MTDLDLYINMLKKADISFTKSEEIITQVYDIVENNGEKYGGFKPIVPPIIQVNITVERGYTGFVSVTTFENGTLTDVSAWE